jgi:SAM-dependent methyltransferase
VTLHPIISEEPDFGVEQFDLITSFDVLEHVSRPDKIASRLVKALRRGGLLAVRVSFDHRTPDFPHHLASGAARFGSYRWDLFLRSRGMRPLDGFFYQRTGRLATIARRTRYELWRRTGVVLFQRVPR